MGGHELWERETTIVDPAAGDGGLLLAAAAGIWRRLAQTPKHRALQTSDEVLLTHILGRMRGVELRADAVRAAQEHMPGVIQGDGLTADTAGALVIMNPPWAGRSKRDATTSRRIAEITGHGVADLAVAFLRAHSNARQISAILPASVTEGVNRRAGLTHMLAAGWQIVSSTTKRPWPGAANVMYVTVHMQPPIVDPG